MIIPFELGLKDFRITAMEKAKIKHIADYVKRNIVRQDRGFINSTRRSPTREADSKVVVRNIAPYVGILNQARVFGFGRKLPRRTHWKCLLKARVNSLL